MKRTLFLVVLISCMLCDKSSDKKGAAPKPQKEGRPLARDEKTIPIAFEKIEKSPRVWPDLQSTYENLFKEHAPPIVSNTELRIGDTGKAIHGIDWKRDSAWCFAGKAKSPYIAALLDVAPEMPMYRDIWGVHILRIENGYDENGMYHSGVKKAELEFYEALQTGDYLVGRAKFNSRYMLKLEDMAAPQSLQIRLEPSYPPPADGAPSYRRVVYLFRLLVTEVHNPKKPACLARFNLVPAERAAATDFSWEPEKIKPYVPYKPKHIDNEIWDKANP